MSKRNVADEWKLEGANQPQQQWVLQEAEQKSLGPWQLQDQPQIAIEWQPVDYVRDRRGGANWILPTFVGVALVAALAYAGWVVLNRTGIISTAPLAAGTPIATLEAPGAVATVASLPTALPPTPTLAAPTPTSAPPTPVPTPLPPTPVPVAIVELASAIITADNGVNARREPSLTGAVIRIVNKDEKLLVAAQQPDWVQVALSANELAWVTAEFVQTTAERVTLEVANQRRAAVGLPPLSSAAALSTTTGLTATLPLTAPLTGSTGTTTTAIAPNVAPTVTATTLQATIVITTGLNARSSPDLAANNVIRLLTNGETHTAIARSPDNQWVQIRLTEDNRLAWVASEYVRLSGDLSTLPVAQPTAAGPVAPLSAVSSTNPITPTQAISPGVTNVVSGATASVSYLGGANARPTPDATAAPLQTLPFDSVLPIVGRNADGSWIKVTLEEGQLAWVIATEVKIDGDIADLPVVN